MSKDKRQTVTAAINEEINAFPELKEVREMAREEYADNDKIINILTVMGKCEYFEAINQMFNNALAAAGIDINNSCRNFVKLYCINAFVYSVDYFVEKEFLQRKITADVLEISGQGEELDLIMLHFADFCKLLDYCNIITTRKNYNVDVSDEQLKRFISDCIKGT